VKKITANAQIALRVVVGGSGVKKKLAREESEKTGEMKGGGEGTGTRRNLQQQKTRAAPRHPEVVTRMIKKEGKEKEKRGPTSTKKRGNGGKEGKGEDQKLHIPGPGREEVVWRAIEEKT